MASRTSRGLLLLSSFLVAIAMAVACSSSSHPSPPMTAIDSSPFSFDAPVVFDAVQASDAPYVKCGTETCTRGDVCVIDRQSGEPGGMIEAGPGEAGPSEAGSSEAGSSEAGSCSEADATIEGGPCSPVEAGPVDSGTTTTATYHCKGLLSACDGTLSCACAGSLCDPGLSCQGAQGFVLTCQPEAG